MLDGQCSRFNGYEQLVDILRDTYDMDLSWKQSNAKKRKAGKKKCFQKIY